MTDLASRVSESMRNATSAIFFVNNAPVPTTRPLIVIGFPDNSGNVGYLVMKTIYNEGGLKMKIQDMNSKLNISLYNQSNSLVAEMNNLALNRKEFDLFREHVAWGVPVGIMVGNAKANHPLHSNSILVLAESPEPFMMSGYEIV